jgi:hypothetical protein
MQSKELSSNGNFSQKSLYLILVFEYSLVFDIIFSRIYSFCNKMIYLLTKGDNFSI